MLLKKDQPLFGVHPVLLREAARTLDGPFNTRALAETLGVPEPRCGQLLDDLIKEEWVRDVLSADGRPNGFFVGTVEWSRLGAARIGTPLARKKADLLVAQLLEDVRRMNREGDPQFALVTGVWIFGSYLNAEKLELGDVDIMVDLATPSGPGQPRVDEDELWAATLKALRRFSPYLSLSSYELTKHLDTPRQAYYRLEEDSTLWRDSRASGGNAHLRYSDAFLGALQSWLGSAEASQAPHAELDNTEISTLMQDLQDAQQAQLRKSHARF